MTKIDRLKKFHINFLLKKKSKKIQGYTDNLLI